MFYIQFIKMKLKKIFGNVWNSIKAFPLSHGLLFILTVLAIISICIDTHSMLISNLSLACGLSLIFSLYLPLYNLQKSNSTDNKWSKTWWIVLPIIFGVVYFFIIRNIDLLNSRVITSDVLNYWWIFVIAIIWLFALIALVSKKDENKTRYSRLWIISAWFMWCVACGVIWWWIAGALAAIEALFDVRISSDVYLIMWAIVWILISGSFILNYYQYLISNTIDVKSTNDRNSRIRKIFWNYIFFGLTLIYIAIFLVYGAKILITWIRPKWIIVRLWIWYFCLGLITTFLIQPSENKFSKITSMWINYSFLFTSFMMIWAILKRINQYWFTMNRFFICAVIVLILVYSILSLIKSKNRRLIFSSSLLIIALFSVYWPVNAKNISLNSQINRLKDFCAEQNIELPIKQWWLSDLTWDLAAEMNRLISNLFDNYKIKKWNQWIVDENIEWIFTWTFNYQNKSQLFEYLQLEESWQYTTYDSQWTKINYFNFYANDTIHPIDIQWYSKIYELQARDECSPEPRSEFCRQKDNVLTDWNIIFDLNPNLQEIQNREWELWPIILDHWNYKLIIKSLNWVSENNEPLRFSSCNGFLLEK